jgi:hypothetical protein
LAPSLSLSEDERGLNFNVDLPNVSYAKDILENVTRQNLCECSFAFVADEDSWDEESEGGQIWPVRTLHSVSLKDISIVLRPAYPETLAEASASDSAPLATVWSAPTPRGAPDFFPTGVPTSFPVEVRARLLSGRQHSSKSRESQHRIVNFILGL